MKTEHWLELERLVKAHGWRAGAEIGVLRGRVFGHLLETCPDLTMIAVDQWKQLPDNGEPGLETYRKFNMATVRRQAVGVAARFPGRCKVEEGPSTEVAKIVPNESLDFVFIDALHTERAVRADIAAWMPKVKPGGYLTGHDWHRPEVRLVLDDMLVGWAQHPESVWSFPVN